jgi:hypothetical protein
MIGGSCSEARLQKNDDGSLIIDPKTGKPASDFTIGIAIPKAGEQHWSQTAWGSVIWNVGVAAYPAQSQTPSFSWKIIDGDSQVPNKKNRKPCDQTGYPGHWVLWLTNGWAPTLCDTNRQPVGPGAIMPGDWVQVYTSVVANTPRPGKSHTPGVYLNLTVVAWVGFHKDGRIAATVNLNEINFDTIIPPGATLTPKTSAWTPAPVAAPAPNPAIWQTGAPAPIGPQMTPSANGVTYEAYRAAGWTDEALREQGLMI